MLAAGKGWVLAMLAMLAAKRRLRVAARGSGPGAKRRRPCPPLRAVATWKASGRRASRRIDAKRACRPGVEQRADREASQAEAAPLLTPVVAWPVNALGAPYSGLSVFSASHYRPRGKQPLAVPKTARQLNLQIGQIEVAENRLVARRGAWLAKELGASEA